MKLLRCASLLCLCASFNFGASKEMVELQRDVAILQNDMRQVQHTLDEQFARLGVLLQQTQDNTAKTNSTMGGIQASVGDAVNQQIQPVARMGEKFDGLADDIRVMRDAVNDLTSKMSKLDAKVTDLGNRMSIMQNPPSAPGGPGAAPGQQGAIGPDAGQGAPPQGMTAEASWETAEKDRLGGNLDLALKEYQDYLTYFPTTEYAPAAQYSIGEIYYTKGDYDNAVKAFDTVLERFPDNPKTRTAHYMKGQTLLRKGDRDGAVQEFKFILQNYSGSDDARRAALTLKGLGVATSTKPSPARRTAKK